MLFQKKLMYSISLDGIIPCLLETCSAFPDPSERTRCLFTVHSIHLYLERMQLFFICQLTAMYMSLTSQQLEWSCS